MKVLVIDDDAKVRDALEIGIQLQWEDAQVLTATDGEVGLERFFNEEPDIVLLDVSMPHMNGFEVLKAIRLVSDVPVIMLRHAAKMSTRCAASSWAPTTISGNRSVIWH